MKTHPWQEIPAAENIEQELTPGVRSAARALRVFEFFDEVRRPARAREIWERLGLPQSTTSLLLNGLVALGYLDYDPAVRSFQPSLRVTMLGQWRDLGHGYSSVLVGLVTKLFERTGLSASLSNRQGIFLRYLHIVQSERAGQPHTSLNARRYAVWSTAGMVLLMDSPEKEIQKIIRNTIAERSGGTRRIQPEQILDRLAIARKQGYFSATGLVTANVRSISMLVPTEITKNDARIAITLAGIGRTMDSPDDEIVRTIRAEIAALPQ